MTKTPEPDFGLREQSGFVQSADSVVILKKNNKNKTKLLVKYGYYQFALAGSKSNGFSFYHDYILLQLIFVG